MELLMLAVGLAVVIVLGLGLYEARCVFGFHPTKDRRMKPGVRGRNKKAVSTGWECYRCGKFIGSTEYAVNVPLLRELRKQVGGSRERSKVINFHVVKTDQDKQSA